MKAYRTFLGIVSLVVVSTMLMSCGGPAPTTEPAVTTAPEEAEEAGEATEVEEVTEAEEVSAEPIAITYLGAFVGTYGEVTGETYLLKKTGEMFGFEWNVQQVSGGDLQDKINVLLASGDLPDVMQTNNLEQVNEYGPRGLFLALDNYIEQGKLPNYKKWLDKFPDETATWYAPDGHLYVAGRFSEIGAPSAVLSLRGDLLKAGGYDTTRLESGDYTFDDLYEACEVLSEQLGGKPAWGNREGFSRWLQQITNFFVGRPGPSIYWDYGKEEFAFAPYTVIYKDMIGFFNRLWEAGLLHSEYATMSDEDWFSIACGSCEAGAFLENAGWSFEFCGKEDLWPVPPKSSGLPSLFSIPQAMGWGYWALSAESDPKAVEAFVQFLDWSYTPEGSRFYIRGEKGVMWEEDPDDPMGWSPIGYKAGIRNADSDLPDLHELLFQEQSFERLIPEEIYLGLSYPEPGDRLDRVREYYAKIPPLVQPPIIPRWTEEELEMMKDVGVPLQTLVDEEIQKFVEGRRPMDEWEDFLNECREAGADDMVKIYNDALARMK